MTILLLGGTRFLGRHLVAAARARHHTVTIFHRGSQPWEGPETVAEVLGDRHHDLASLQGQTWDAVVDTCGYLPQSVRHSARALAAVAGQYAFISSVAAYADFGTPNYTEAASLATLTTKQTAQVAALDVMTETSAASLGNMYGALKALCEQEVRAVFGPAALLVRPGLLVGPYDPTDRFTYWVNRVEQGNEILAPGRAGRFVQLLDARDLADWLILLLESRAGGTYNAAGKPFELTFGQLLHQLRPVEPVANSAFFTWVSGAFLQQQAVGEWQELPLYLAESDPSTHGFLAANVDKALAANLTFRPLAATIQDTRQWRTTIPEPLRAGLAPAKEQYLLRQWHALPR